MIYWNRACLLSLFFCCAFGPDLGLPCFENVPQAEENLAFRERIIESLDFRASMVGNCHRRLESTTHVCRKLPEPVGNDRTVAFCRDKEGNRDAIVMLILDDHSEQLGFPV